MRVQPLQTKSPANILFIGGVFSKAEEFRVLAKSHGTVQFAANALQWNLIRGLDAATIRPVTLLNAVFVGSYPKLYRDAWIRGRRWSHTPGADDETIGFLNIFGVKQIWRACALIRKARKWAASPGSGSARAIVIYSMHMPFILAAALAKRIDPAVKLCLVVPDLPEHMNLSASVAKSLAILKAMDTRIMDRFMGEVDCFALLTRHMAGPLGVGRRPWIVMEGAVNPDEAPRKGPALATTGASEKIILYTGSLTKAYGILELLEAFAMLTDPTYRLWICGAGEAESEVTQAAARDRRVRFLGQIARDEAIALQRQANVLVNPRSDAGEFTRYSFPSKIMEYMLSGTPTIVRRLPGIPDEYFDHLFVINGASPADMAKKIDHVCRMSADDRRRVGEMAQRFVIEQKNARSQACRILDLISSAGT